MNIQPLTPQQVFDNALFGIRKQGYVRSALPDGQCRLRDDSGRSCAIGKSIPDALYTPEMEIAIATAMDQPCPEFEQLLKLFADCEVNLLQLLQKAHDQYLPDGSQCFSSGGHDYELLMQRIASQYNLVYTLPTSPVGSDTSGESA